MSPADFAAIALRKDARDVVDIARIKHGLTNESWLVTLGRDKVVVRLSSPDDAALQIDRDSEAVILRTVAAAGIGPEVLLCDPAQRVLVTRYLGPTWTDEEARQSANISRLGAILRRLHALSPPPGVHRVRLVSVIDDYAATLSIPVSATARRTAQHLDSAAHGHLCHNDVHALNIIDHQEIQLIDWEYAGLGAPLFDLASVCVYHRYDQAQRTQLLLAYTQRKELSTNELDEACELFDYIRDLWTRVRDTVQAPQ